MSDDWLVKLMINVIIVIIIAPFLSQIFKIFFASGGKGAKSCRCPWPNTVGVTVFRGDQSLKRSSEISVQENVRNDSKNVVVLLILKKTLKMYIQFQRPFNHPRSLIHYY